MWHLSYRLITRGLQRPNSFGYRNQCLRLQSAANQFNGIVQLSADCGRCQGGGSADKRSSSVAVIGGRRPIVMSSRNASSKSAPVDIRVYGLTRNMHFYSSTRSKWNKDSKTLRLKEQLDKPLVLMLAWLQASEKHLAKYAEFYIEQGFEVLVAHISPWQLMWPVHGSQAVANDIVKFMRNNDLNRGVVLHGFSVGGYLWGECLVKINEDESNKPVLDKIKGQIWDSAADITEIPVGVPHAVLPKNPTLQSALRGYITYHLKLFHEEATQYYEKCNNLYFYEPARCPALLLVSKTDPVGTESANKRLMEAWETVGVKTTMKCWDRSPHVGHFHKHREEYIDQLLTHLSTLNIAGYFPKAKL
ncbi:transmembrane protein 53-like [Ochlerotatus camptorhynchus]|uniref:transmembrane protein 53-like n=1 Tax=Ochlerotatus camptorhynchus TaxID=644619 RepID=UPI0031CE7A6E